MDDGGMRAPGEGASRRDRRVGAVAAAAAKVALLRTRAWLATLFEQTAVPLLALVALVWLLIGVGQTRDVLADIFGRIFVGAPDLWGGLFQRFAAIAYMAVWIATLLFAGVLALSARVLAPVRAAAADGRTPHGNEHPGVLLRATICAVHASFIAQAGMAVLAMFQVGLLVACELVVAARFAVGSRRWRIRVAACLGATLAFLAVLALAAAGGEVSRLSMQLGLPPPRGWDDLVNPLFWPTLASAWSAQICLLVGWAMRERRGVAAPAGRRVPTVALLAVAVLLPAGLALPWQVREVLLAGSLPVVLAWLAWLVAVLTFVALGRRKLGVPVLPLVTAAIGLLVVLHRERTGQEQAPAVEADAVASANRRSPVALVDIDPALRAKLAFPALAHPLVISADGGGLRAALFTASVLAYADDYTCGQFGKQVRMASGVSGGSLGLATWLVLRQEYVRRSLLGGKQPWQDCWKFVDDGTKGAADPRQWPLDLSLLVQYTLVQDHLTMPLFGMLTSDLLPSSASARRGQLLVDSWQDAALTAMPAVPETGFTPLGYAREFAQVTGGLDPPPAVAFNATDADTGRLVVLSNAPWHAGIDATKMPVGVAALDSARFPFISPAGLLDDAGTMRRVVDGGYFDNTGAIALATLLREPGAQVPPGTRYLRIDGSTTSDQGHCDWSTTARTNFDEWSVSKALSKVRSVHGELAVARLDVATEGGPGRMDASPVDLEIMAYGKHCPDVPGQTPAQSAVTCHAVREQLCRSEEDARRLPLGWYLSQQSGIMIVGLARMDVVRMLCDQQASFNVACRAARAGEGAATP